MKVVLLRDVAKIGRRNSVVEVADGLALNKLIPRGDAVQATPANLKRVENLKQKGIENKADLLQTLQSIAEAITNAPLVIKMQANEQGHLFKGVHADDVIAAAKERGFNLAKEWMVVENHLKSVGEHVVGIKAEGKTYTFPIVVEAK